MPLQLKQVQDFLADKKIGLALIFNSDSNFKYFNSCNDFHGVLAIQPNKTFILSSLLELKTAKLDSLIKPVYAMKKDMVSMIKSKITRFNKIGINMDNVSVNQYAWLKKNFKNAKFADISKDLARLRAQKTPEELSIIKKACAITDSIFRNTAEMLDSGKTEIEVANFIKAEMRKNSVTEAFTTIVATGRNSTDIHHKVAEEKLKGCTIIDIGVKYKNYCSDMTRTFYIGEPGENEINAYNNVLAVLNGIKTIDDVKKLKPLKMQVHSLGHSIGIDVHEKPRLEMKNEIGNGMVFAIEPAAYYKDYGMRIEDMFLVKNNKFIKLTRFPRELVIKKEQW